MISLLREYWPLHPGNYHIQSGYVGALFKAILFLGILGKERLHFRKMFFWSLARRPRLFPLAITYAVYGFHFRMVAEKINWNGICDANDAFNEKDGYHEQQ